MTLASAGGRGPASGTCRASASTAPPSRATGAARRWASTRSNGCAQLHAPRAAPAWSRDLCRRSDREIAAGLIPPAERVRDLLRAGADIELDALGIGEVELLAVDRQCRQVDPEPVAGDRCRLEVDAIDHRAIARLARIVIRARDR